MNYTSQNKDKGLCWAFTVNMYYNTFLSSKMLRINYNRTERVPTSMSCRLLMMIACHMAWKSFIDHVCLFHCSSLYRCLHDCPHCWLYLPICPLFLSSSMPWYYSSCSQHSVILSSTTWPALSWLMTWMLWMMPVSSPQTQCSNVPYVILKIYLCWFVINWYSPLSCCIHLYFSN